MFEIVASSHHLWRCVVDFGEARCPCCTETVPLLTIGSSQIGRSLKLNSELRLTTDVETFSYFFDQKCCRSLAWNIPLPRNTTGAKPMMFCKFDQIRWIWTCESSESKIFFLQVVIFFFSMGHLQLVLHSTQSWSFWVCHLHERWWWSLAKSWSSASSSPCESRISNQQVITWS